MRKSSPAYLPVIATLASAWASACGTSTGQSNGHDLAVPDAQILKKIGEACTADSDCGSKLAGMALMPVCSTTDMVCTIACASQADCPEGFDCGFAHPADGAMGGAGATCYKARWQQVAKGGYGTDCGAYSPDPATGTACDEKAMSPCADGFTCRGDIKCDASAYCTKECSGDPDCPPTMYCALDVSTGCTTDGDCRNGKTCQPSADGAMNKVCAGKSWCRTRTQCSPCGTADQCPVGYLCAVDTMGERFCGKACTADENCPYPVGGMTGAFMSCVDATNGSGNSVCRPLQGACHSISAVMGNPAGGLCAWCREGIPSDCVSGFCVITNTLEHFCAQGCKQHLKKGANGYSKSGPTGCPSAGACVITAPADCGAGCDAEGWCDPSPNGVAPTCYRG